MYYLSDFCFFLSKTEILFGDFAEKNYLCAIKNSLENHYQSYTNFKL